MENIIVTKKEMTEEQKINFATEVAFNALIKQAKDMGLDIYTNIALMYLSDQGLTRQFQKTCRTILDSLKVEDSNAQ